jgi:Rrf2 family protein
MSSVFHLSEASNLALHTLTLLASEPDRPLRVADAADALSVSQNHLSKVMQRLARAGLVSSTRGPKGGFVLARPPKAIRLLEVYEAIDGVLETHLCLLGKEACTPGCVLGSFASQANSDFRALLGRTRLSDVARIMKREDQP